MKLKLQLRKFLKKHGRTLASEVLEEVALEERVQHACWGAWTVM